MPSCGFSKGQYVCALDAGRVKAMSQGTVSKVVRSFGASWGRIRPDGEPREVFFNASTFVDASDYEQLAVGQRVEYDEEPDRANGSRAIRVRFLSAEARSG
jgi:cold shock CspA family protein